MQTHALSTSQSNLLERRVFVHSDHGAAVLGGTVQLRPETPMLIRGHRNRGNGLLRAASLAGNEARDVVRLRLPCLAQTTRNLRQTQVPVSCRVKPGRELRQ